MNIIDKIYDKIKVFCKEKSVSVARVEREAGLKSGAISKWNNSSPTVTNLNAVASVLGVPITDIIESED